MSADSGRRESLGVEDGGAHGQCQAEEDGEGVSSSSEEGVVKEGVVVDVWKR